MPRTILFHVQLEVPDDDERSVPELVARVEETLGFSGFSTSDRAWRFEILAAQLTKDSTRVELAGI